MSQNGGGPGSGGRDITLYLGSDNPELLLATANKIVDEMTGLKEIRAPRVQGDLSRPEITIKPRFDLAADLGVTTTALSPDDPHRDAGRHCAEQRKILAGGSPGPDHRIAGGEARGATCRPREFAGSDFEAADRSR